MTLLERLLSIGYLRKKIWGLWYPYLTRQLRDEDVLFLNYSFATEPAVELALSPEDEPNRYCIQLYHHVATQADLQGKNVLEVSCGHGGGASWITRTLGPASYTGLDLNPEGIRFCQRRHSAPGLKFLTGNAQELPFPDQSLDVVINVEASHCYPNFAGFLREVQRVLRPGGQFLYADFRFADQLDPWLQDIKACPLQLIQTRNISQEVRLGLDHSAPRNLQLVERCLPGFLQSSGRDFAGVPGSVVYEALRQGTLSYRSWRLDRTA